jgi:hypothetical protein
MSPASALLATMLGYRTAQGQLPGSQGLGVCVTHTLPLFCQVLNVSFAFELMQDGGLEKPKPRPEGTLPFPSLEQP